MRQPLSAEFSAGIARFSDDALGRSFREYIATQEAGEWAEFTYKDKSAINKMLRGIASLLAAASPMSQVDRGTP